MGLISGHLQIHCLELYIALHLIEVKKKKYISELGIYNNRLNTKKSKENQHLEKPISFKKEFIKENYTRGFLNC